MSFALGSQSIKHRVPLVCVIAMHSSRMCKDCPHFVEDDQFNSVLTCSYQEKPKQQEKEHQEKNVFDAADLRKTVKELQEYGVKAESILKESARSTARKKKAAKPGGRKKKGGAG